MAGLFFGEIGEGFWNDVPEILNFNKRCYSQYLKQKVLEHSVLQFDAHFLTESV